MALFFYLIIFHLINYILSISKENDKFNSTINYLMESDEFNLPKCFDNFSLNAPRALQNVSSCVLKQLRDYPDKVHDFLINQKDLIIVAARLSGKNVLYMLANDLLNNETNTLLKDIFDFIKIKKDSKSVLDYFIEILSKDYNTFFSVFMKLKEVFNFDGFKDFFNKIYQRYKYYLYDFIELIPDKKDNNKKTFIPILKSLKGFVQKYQDIIIEVFYNLISHYNERDRMTYDLRDFVLYNCSNSDFLDDFKSIIFNDTLIHEVLGLIKFDSAMADTVIRVVLVDKKLINLTFYLLHNETVVKNLSEIVINIYNKKYINKYIPKFLKDIIGNNTDTKDILINGYVNILKNVLTEKNLKYFVGSDLLFFFKDLLTKGFVRFNLSSSCARLFNHIYFSPEEQDNTDFKFFYVKKLLIDSSKSKNDFLTYENCLKSYDNSNDSLFYQIKPVYVVGKIIDRYNQSELKNSIYYEKYNYIISFCFPQGINRTTNENFCSETDYGKLLQIFNSLSNNMNKTEVEAFVLTEDDLKGETEDYIYFSLITIITTIPLVISIFLFLYKIIKLSRTKKNVINNKLIPKNKIENIIISKEKETKRKKIPFKVIAPKCYRILNEYFNLINNGSELFDFSLNQTNFNNFNGITYIKGILGSSMFLNIFGLTFFILSNLPTKILGTYQFYHSVINPFYILAFIGLRYCPRIIFSCSGYTLIYKFLNFVEHDSKCSFFKFLILQSYKFILLICVVIYLRYCLYYIDVLFSNVSYPMSELFHNVLEDNNDKFFYNLLSFLFYNCQEDELFTNESAIIQYLYLPINEIFLFIVGIALISFGYKFKLRFDIIIIISFILIYLFKLLFFILYLYKREIYSTLYFFMRGYGVLMLNPIFNLPSFLIGMYFGLVNYTIQRGINNLSKVDKYKEYELLNQSRNDSIKRMKTKEKKEFIFDNTNSENLRINRISTYSISISSTYDNNEFFNNSNNKSFIKEDESEITKSNAESNILSETNEKLIDMPYLKSTVSFTNFHRRNQDNIILKIILFISIIFILFFILVKYIFIYIHITINLSTNKKLIDTLSFDKIIPNYFLNILYAIDIEIVVILINWISFYLYFKGGQINDFFSHIYWSFFIKSYFSYALVSSPVILFIFYQSETIIEVTIFDILLYSLISCFFVFVIVIVFYSCYEYPMRKIFKTFRIRRTYINLDDDESNDEEND